MSAVGPRTLMRLITLAYIPTARACVTRAAYERTIVYNIVRAKRTVIECKGERNRFRLRGHLIMFARKLWSLMELHLAYL